MVSHKTFICYLAACLIGSSFANPSHSSSNAIVWQNCSQNAPDMPEILDLATVDLNNLPSTLHCGSLVVPMDHANPICADNQIILGLAMHRPHHPKGIIFFNAGGSDPNVITAWLVALNKTAAFNDLLDFDIMFMDIRGTYSSNALNISTAGFDAINTILVTLPTTEEEFNAARGYSKTFIQSWVDSSTPPGIVEHLGTKETVQDYEHIRRALGYEKIHFLGSSYGSYRAAQYAATFPERVGNFVLDAVIAHGRTRVDQFTDSVAALNRGLLRADAYCQSTATCPWQANGTGILPEILAGIITTAEQSPIPIPVCLLESCYDSSSAVAIKETLLTYFAEPDFPSILGALGLALEGNATYLPAGPQTDINNIVSIPLECADYNDQDLNFSEWQELLAASNYSDPSSMGYTLQIQLTLGCLGWPYASAKQERLHINNKMLLVTADFDALAPFEWAGFVWETAPESALVVRHGDDHTSFSLVGQPAVKIMVDYLRTGVLPKARDEELVSVYTRGMKAPAVKSPYDVPTGALAGDTDVGDSGNITVPVFLL